MKYVVILKDEKKKKAIVGVREPEKGNGPLWSPLNSPLARYVCLVTLSSPTSQAQQSGAILINMWMDKDAWLEK